MNIINLLFGDRTKTMTTDQKRHWQQAFTSKLVTYAGPACAGWQRESLVLCEHDSCWDIMTEGASAYYRRVQEVTGALC